ncbi:hypothetical protein [Streptomyces sp. NPDC050121]|uniref:hypothetical protein n=1 Tax=Streptomyces sp. NPDC050121 TaxID=3365601 RepID=UPI003795975C
MTETVVEEGAGGWDNRPGYGQGREALMAAAVKVVARGGLRKPTCLDGLVFHQVTSGAPERTEEGVEALRRLLAAHRAQASPRATGGTLNGPNLSGTHFGSGDDEHFPRA